MTYQIVFVDQSILYAIMPSRLDSLVIGALLAIAVRDSLWRDRIYRYRKPLTLRNQLSQAFGIVAESLVIVPGNVIVYWVARASWRYYEGPILRLKSGSLPSNQSQAPGTRAARPSQRRPK